MIWTQLTLPQPDDHYFFEENYEYSPSGNIAWAGDVIYSYERLDNAQAATFLEGPDFERDLVYDDAGGLVSDLKVEWDENDAETWTDRQLIYDAAGCLNQVKSVVETGDDDPVTLQDATTSFVCGQGGRRALRKTTDHLTGKTQRVIDFAGLAEIRPDDGPDGILLLRLPAGGTTVVEEARSLINGARVYEESGYVHSDVRSSILAKTDYEGAALLMTHAAEYDAWGNTVTFTGADAPRHRFVGFEPDPTTGNYFFGARVYDPTLKRWLSPDPLILSIPEFDEDSALEFNLYAYTSNNPSSLTDPSGMSSNVHKDLDYVGGGGGGMMRINLRSSTAMTRSSQASSAMTAGARQQTLIGAASGPALVAGRRMLLDTVGEHIKQVAAELITRNSDEIATTMGASFFKESMSGDVITRQYKKSGGFNQAKADFDLLVGDSPVTRMGNDTYVSTLPDGRSIDVRPSSSGGHSTLEIQRKNERGEVLEKTKVRY
ncbi:MAG: RHS repeat-associated core domain-containing protein [Bradymonadaceae bacterium]